MTKLIIDKKWLDGTIKYPLKINEPYYTEGVQDTLRVLLEQAKPLDKHHQYLSWAIEKKEGWSKINGKWEKVTLGYYAYGNCEIFGFKEKLTTSDNFQLEPPTPQNLTIEQAKEAIENETILEFSDEGGFEKNEGVLVDMAESKIDGNLKYVDVDGYRWPNCSYTKPLGDKG